MDSKLITYSAVFAALYLSITYLSSLAFGSILRGSDAHMVRAALMAILATRLKTPGGPTLMGLLSGILLLGVPAPASFIYLPGSIASGLIYDLCLRIGNYGDVSRRKMRILSSSLFSGLVESTIVTALLFLIGFSFSEILLRLTLGGIFPGVAGIWFYSLGKNAIMSLIGASLAIALIPRFKSIT